MRKLFLSTLLLALGAGSALFFARAEPGTTPAQPASGKAATSKITHVTVFQNTALVTREVDVPEGTGSVELVVPSLPPQTVNSSLYSEGSDGIRVLTTRYRTRAIQEDTREEVRKKQAQLKDLQRGAERLKAEIKTLEQNALMLNKLENFTAVTTTHSTEKGGLNGETVISLSKYVMEQRAEKSKELVALQQQLQTNQEDTQFTQRQLQELAGGSSKVERDAIIVVEKRNAAAGKVRLNYLVNAASWQPQYKLRAGKNKEPVQVEYLAAVVQQTGEDWQDVQLILSTAQPMLNAAPPDLRMLEVSLAPRAPVQPGQAAGMPRPNEQPANPGELLQRANILRNKGQGELNFRRDMDGNKFYNEAAALEQRLHLLGSREELLNPDNRKQWAANEGHSVTYHLNTRLSVPSRNDEQVLEVAKLDLTPEFYYKAVPVLTTHVYRLANLTNKSQHVLLPGEATMYLGSDFVGRMSLPLVVIGEQFTAGFGVDPQLQVQRQLVDKSRTMQGGNQVLKYEYRILLSSYKADPVKLQLWDRLPHAEAETLGVSLVRVKPEVSTDSVYQRENRPNNLLRWDLDLQPTMNGENALAVQYEFKLELDRNMIIGNILSK